MFLNSVELGFLLTEKSEENPETGISDYAIYMVPLSLVLGTTLYLKRRNA